MSKGLTKLQEELKFIRKSGCLAQIGGSAGPINRDFYHWQACFIGPKGSPYEGGLFVLEMKFNSNYPESGPIDVQMRTPTYHPNINCDSGHVCVTYTSSWNKANNIPGILNAVWDLLAEEHPSNGYQSEDKKKASEFKNKYAFEGQSYDWNNSWSKGWSNS